MKRSLFLLFICWHTLSQAQSSPPVSMEDKKSDAYLSNRKPATLVIQIKNLPESVKKVNIKYTLVQLGAGFQATKYAETDANGLSRITLDQNLPYQQIWLSAGDYLYAGIYVNTGLTVTIDTRKVPHDGAYMIGDGITYSGVDGELNTVLNKSALFKKGEKEALFNTLAKLNTIKAKVIPNMFSSKADSILRALTNINNEFIDSYPKYRWAVMNETLSEFYAAVCMAYWNIIMPDDLFKQIKIHQPYFTSNGSALFYSYLETYSIANKHYNPSSCLDSTLKTFDQLYTQQKSDILKLFLLNQYEDNFSKDYPLIIGSIKTKWVKRVSNNELTTAILTQKRVDSLFAISTKLDRLGLEKPLVELPFGAKLYQLDTLSNIGDLIVSLKSRFAKKALIIDFWATWCGPCLEDIPFSKSLHKKNNDLPIEYIYLCTSSSSTVDIWKHKVAELEIPGIHIYVNDKIIAKLKTAFNAEGGFPTYVLIDINGKIKPKAISYMQSLDRESLKKVAGL
jgi:thiol-disulfide isomerase/thioredoxin